MAAGLGVTGQVDAADAIGIPLIDIVANINQVHPLLIHTYLRNVRIDLCVCIALGTVVGADHVNVIRNLLQRIDVIIQHAEPGG